ncbi:MAG: glycine cleavage system aminomethyltransferase GcvT [Spirochaetia bacterium]|jgi:aminomethyltransferase|nr:glycine cleavage system aminomethyltransferase GcvT [Spirochaetia bacterium]
MGKRTPLYEKHLKLGGRIVDFAGWDLPVQYTSAIDEHMAVRTNAGLFDISHMGEFSVKGKESQKYLESLVPTSFSKLEDGKGMYSCLCNEKGGIIDDFFIFRIAADDFYLVVNAGTREKDFKWLQANLKGDVVLEDLSDITAKIDVQGPLSKGIMEKVFSDVDFESLERFHFTYSKFNEKPVMISNTGYTGEAGYELFIDPAIAGTLWDLLLEKGKPFNLLPCGLASRDSLRLEACYSLYGHELNENVNPFEAGLSWIVNSEKKYVASDILKKVKEDGPERRTVCLVIKDKGIPREGYRVMHEGADIGHVTSGGYSPVMKKGIAFALVKAKAVKTGSDVDIVIRDKNVGASVVKRPFYSFNG